MDNDVNVLITVRCGQNAADVFAAAGIKIYKSVQKTRHTERNRTAEQIRKNKKTCPEETVYQIGMMDNHVPPEILMKVVAEFMDTLEKHGLCSLWIGAYLCCLCFL